MSSLDHALTAMAAGDVERLAALLRSEPDLAHARVPGAGAPRDGYFHRATLLHHVSGNPEITPVPATAVALCDLLLDAGADIDAHTQAGPTQPDDCGWTTLGLVATSMAARAAGVQRALLDRLVERGADPGVRRSTPLAGALFYGELEAAAWLVEHGAPVDLRLAAGLGRLDLAEQWLGSDGAPKPGAGRCSLYPTPLDAPPPEGEEIVALALVLAAMQGRTEACALLLDRGADIAAQPEWHRGATALHWAAWCGRDETVDLLVARGAPLDARDRAHGATPAHWAGVAGRLDLHAKLGGDHLP